MSPLPSFATLRSMSSTDPAARSLADDEIEAVLALARAHSLEELLAKLSHCCVEGLGGDWPPGASWSWTLAAPKRFTQL